MAESLCQKRALEAFHLDPAKWGGIELNILFVSDALRNNIISCHMFCLSSISMFSQMFA